MSGELFSVVKAVDGEICAWDWGEGGWFKAPFVHPDNMTDSHMSAQEIAEDEGGELRVYRVIDVTAEFEAGDAK